MDENTNDPITDPTTDPTTDTNTNTETETSTEPTPPAENPIDPTYKAVGLDVLEDMFLAFGQGLPGLLVGEGGTGTGGSEAIITRLLPPGGAKDAILTKITENDYDIAWKTPATVKGMAPSGGTSGQVLSKVSDTDYDLGWSTVTIPEVVKLTSTEVTSIAAGNIAEITDADKKVLGVNGLVELLDVVRQEDGEIALSADEITITKDDNNIISIKEVPGMKLVDSSVVTIKIADDAILTSKIKDANVTAAKMADDVWVKVNDIMDNGFAEVLNGSY